MSNPVYFQRPVLLDRIRHRKHRVAASQSFGFARNANSIYLAGVEFAESCKEYAIVFIRGPNRKIAPVAMLGLSSGENLFVDERDGWTGTYVPAFVRCYPFVLAQLPDQDMAVCVDEAYSGLNETAGEPLFDAEGKNTPFLQNALDFLTRQQQEYRRTEELCQRLEQAGLFKEMNAKADLVDGRSYTVSGLLMVDEEKLMALPDATVLSLFRTGELHLVSMHLLSLSNMKWLIDRMSKRKGPAPGATPR